MPTLTGIECFLIEGPSLTLRCNKHTFTPKHNLSHIQTFLSIGQKPRKSGRESDWFLTVVQSEEPKAFLFNYRVITDQ